MLQLPLSTNLWERALQYPEILDGHELIEKVGPVSSVTPHAGQSIAQDIRAAVINVGEDSKDSLAE